jgi:hypothetical protein
VLLCVDYSGSIGPAALADMKFALVSALADGPKPELAYQIALMGFGSQPRHLLGFTSQAAQLAPAIARLRTENERAGKTRMLDAIAAGLAMLRAEGAGARRVIVVSDGKDEGSTISAEALGRLAQSPDPIPIDAIAYGPLAQGSSGPLASVAGGSGGRFIAAGNARQLTEALQRLTSDLAPAPAYQVAFEYTPAAGKRVSESARLVYTPEGSPAIERALDASVAAPSESDAGRSEPAATPDPDDRGPLSRYFHIALRFVLNVPPALGALATAVLAIALLLLVGRRKPVEPDRPPLVKPDPGSKVMTNPTPPAPRRRTATQVGFQWPMPSPGQPVAILRGVSGASRGAQFAVEKAVYRIGCSPDNDLVLIGEDFASGRHALLRAEGNALYVEDLGSLNGSYLNGVAFKSATRALAPRDELRFGHTVFEVLSTTAGPGAARPAYEPAPL